jgi:hypothetical protein
MAPPTALERRGGLRCTVDEGKLLDAALGGAWHYDGEASTLLADLRARE